MPQILSLRKALALLSLGLALASPPSSAKKKGPAEGRGGEAENHQVPATSATIEVDGRLDEGAWTDALVVELQYETWPGENVEPPVQTEVLLTYTPGTLYVGFRAHDPNPSAIRAHLSDRDRAWGDDLVGIVIDTFNDERRAYEFLVNPLGVQMDQINDGVRGRVDSNWDAIWQSVSRITEAGYIVEISIPFSALTFPREKGPQTWGFDAFRFYPRGQSHRIATVPVDRNESCHLCQLGKIEGFADITPGRNLEINPTLTAARTDSREELTDDLEDGDVDSEPGLNVRWGVTPNLTLNGTINPDFSQVEADVAQLDINERFALFFPEKRPFFLEGADFFKSPFNIVHTRTVADPNWGLKLTGKQGRNGVALFVAEDDLTNLIFPGSQGSESTSLEMENTTAVVRYRRDVGQSSSLGFLFTDREATDYFNRVGAFDGLWRVAQSDLVRFQWLGSETRYPGEVAEEFDQPSDDLDDMALIISYDHQERNWWWGAAYRDIGEEFRADVGFLPRVDVRLGRANLGHVWYGGEEAWWTQLSLGGEWRLTEDQSGQELARSQQVNVWVNGPLQSFLFFFAGQADRFFDGVTFEDQRFQGLGFQVRPSGTFSLGLHGSYGDGIDFEHTRPAKGLRLDPNLRLNLGRHLSVRLRHTLEELDVEGEQLFEANLSQLRVVYQFNVRTFVRAILQYRKIDRNVELYESEVEPTTEEFFSQFLFSYKLNPRTVLFVGYSDTRLGEEEIDLTQTDRTVFLKVGYAWLL